MIKVTVWNENKHEKEMEEVRNLYPDGIHGAIAAFLSAEADIEVRTATLDDPDCGLTEEVLADTDVLIWWGHCAHEKVPDEVAERVQNAVLKGMGFIALHSAHLSKPFRRLMGTSCTLTWREDGDYERLWVCNPSSPIVKGLGRFVEIPHEEAYGEPFDIPEPDQLVLIGTYEGGEVFRSGCCYYRGNGKVFYFQPGHETYGTSHVKDVQTIIKNAVRWAKSDYRTAELSCPNVQKPERTI